MDIMAAAVIMAMVKAATKVVANTTVTEVAVVVIMAAKAVITKHRPISHELTT